MQHLLATSLLSLSSSALGATWTVDDDGPADFTTIQDAIDAAIDGDVVVVEPGTYTSAGDGHVVDMLGKAITLSSSRGATTTIIDGQSARRGIVCVSGETALTIIEGFTVANGLSADYDYDGDGEIDYPENDGGGMLCLNSSPTLNDCVFTANTAYSTNAGGGLWCEYGSPMLTNCTFDGNTAGNAGGLGGIASVLRLDGCTITFNTAVDDPIAGETAGAAGGLWGTGSTMELSDCIIHGNTADLGGGGLWCSNDTQLQMTGCELSGNVAGNHGGGVWIFSSSSVLTDCSIIENQAPWDGGVDCWDSNAVFIDCLVGGNTSTNTFSDGGGGISIHFCASASIIGCSITGNTAMQDGGGVLCEGSTLQITGSTISDNTAGNAGGGIRSIGGSTLTISQTTMCGNTPDPIDGDWIDAGDNGITDSCQSGCPDINGDGLVNVYELLAVIVAWNTDDPAVDVNGDGIVNTDDLLLVISAWGSCS